MHPVAILLLAGLAFLWVKEWRALKHVQGVGAAMRAIGARKFRRRSLGLGLMTVITIVLALEDRIPFVSARERFLFYGMVMILVIWVLILAARDTDEIAKSYVEGSRAVARETIAEIEKQMAVRRDPDQRPIPILKFPPPEEKK